MIKARIYYIVILLTSIFLSTVVKHKAMTMLVLILTAVPIVSLILFTGAVLSLKTDIKSSKTKIKRNKTVQVNVTARCGFFLSFAYAHFVKNDKTTLVMCLPFSFVQKAKYTLKCNQIGVKNISADYIKMYDLSGLFCFKKKIKKQGVEVYPNLLKVENTLFSNSGIDSKNVGKGSTKQDNLSVSYIREYTQNDTMRSVHWKLSSKVNKLMAKNYENILQLYSTVIADVSDEKVRDLIIETAVSIVNSSVKNNLSSRIIFADSDCIVTDTNSFAELLSKTVNTDYTKQYDFDSIVGKYFALQGTKTNVTVIAGKNTDTKPLSRYSEFVNLMIVD